MKALTIWQPWASLLACGAKRFETRSWATNHRGLVAIHAAMLRPTSDPIAVVFENNVEFLNAVANVLKIDMGKWLGWGQGFDALPRGCVVATAELVGCYYIASSPAKSLFRNDHSFMFYDDKSSPHNTKPLNIANVQPNLSVKFGVGSNEALFGDWTHGRYAWEFANMQMLTNPIPAKGRQGLWSWEGET